MARMQLQLEKQLRRKSPIADIVLTCFFVFLELLLLFSSLTTDNFHRAKLC